MRWDGSHNHPRAAFELPNLHLCRGCLRPFVVPERVLDVVGDDRYLVELRCTNCDLTFVETHGERNLEDLDRELDRQQADMHAALMLWEITSFRDDIDAFAAALRDDHVLPEDF